MAKKADIINSFIQAKKSKKNRKLTKVQTVNRLLGSQVLHTNQIIKIKKFVSFAIISIKELSNG